MRFSQHALLHSGGSDEQEVRGSKFLNFMSATYY